MGSSRKHYQIPSWLVFPEYIKLFNVAVHALTVTFKVVHKNWSSFTVAIWKNTFVRAMCMFDIRCKPWPCEIQFDIMFVCR
jgi:hypothetical protein